MLPGNARRLAATYRSMADARFREAIYALETEGRDKFVEFMRDVEQLREQATLADEAATESERRMVEMVAADVARRTA
jgi:hypothetical protein